MGNKLVIILVLVLAVIMAWGFMLDSDSIIVTVNGQRITGPMSGTIGIGGFLIAIIALISAATLLVFVFTGFGLVILGALLFFGIITVAVLFPIFWPVLLPLLIVWLFIAFDQEKKR